MRRHYLDNLRWATVLLVVLYHIIYMYNGVITAGVVGPFAPVQPQDAVQYLLYPWFMVLLFVVSGASARLALERQPPKTFAARRTEKLLVPSTLGLLVFQWVLGGFNMALAGAFDTLPPLPAPVLWLIMAASGCGVLWFAQMLWLFSMALVLLRRFERGRLYRVCGRLGPLALAALGLPLWGAAQVLNAPYIAVYRFGIYAFAFLLGYFVFAQEEVIERLAAHPLPFCAAALALGTAYALRWFGQNYAAPPAVNCPLAGGAGGLRRHEALGRQNGPSGRLAGAAQFRAVCASLSAPGRRGLGHGLVFASARRGLLSAGGSGGLRRRVWFERPHLQNAGAALVRFGQTKGETPCFGITSASCAN